ncbi:short-subunit dehydrogenase [Mucilaginibacter sp. OAE612]|uniref:SDR family oxidoreductase n=1 Tax=Mucilaginibacter sp. OAE612 TaxID=3156444 RepID=UPI00359F044D
MKKVILVTGASSGIGLACASALQAAGHMVYGSSRNLDRMKSVSFKPVQLDVTDDASVKAAIDTIIKAEGKIDVLVNNAGNGVTGPAYAMPVESAKQQFEVNFFGVIRVSSAVLPGMIEKGQGLIVNISSLAGLFGLPYQGMYSASKYAIEGYSQSLRMELRNTGVKVTLLNPGDFKSDFSQNRAKVKFPIKNDKLETEYNAAVAAMEKDESIAPSPESLAKKLVSIVASSSPKHRYLVGQVGQTIVPTLKAILPGGLFEKLMNDHYGIK